MLAEFGRFFSAEPKAYRKLPDAGEDALFRLVTRMRERVPAYRKFLEQFLPNLTFPQFLFPFHLYTLLRYILCQTISNFPYSTICPLASHFRQRFRQDFSCATITGTFLCL